MIVLVGYQAVVEEAQVQITGVGSRLLYLYGPESSSVSTRAKPG